MRDRNLVLAVGMSALLVGGAAALILCKNHAVQLPAPILNVSEPTRVQRFTVRASGESVWEIEAIGSQSLSSMEYGRTPAGFRQVIPPLGVGARALRKGERVLTIREAEGFEFRHSCIAETENSVRCGSWTYGPISNHDSR